MTRRRGRRSRGGTEPQQEIQGFIGEGTCLSGEFVLSGGYRVDGRVTGKLTSSSTLIVGPEGEVEAVELRVSSLVVRGLVRGTLHVENRLEIHDGGKVYGSVTLSKPEFVMAPGAWFEGRLVMAETADR